MANAETSLDRLNQLADQTGRQAGELATLASENAALRGRVEGLEGQLSALRALQQGLVDRLEQALARSGGHERLDALDQRLAAGHASGLRTAERVETVAGEIAALGRLSGSIEQTRADMARQLATHQENAAQSFAGLDARVRRDSESLMRALHEHEARVDRVAESIERVEPLERGRKELSDSIHRLSARIDSLAAERSALEDTIRGGQERADQRIAQLAQTVHEIKADAQSWQERTQEQMAMLRDARTIADQMRQEAERLEDAQLSSARSQQSFEARTEARLTAWRDDIDEELARFIARHDREREQTEREHVAREALREAASLEARAIIEQRVEALAHEVGGRLGALVAEGLELRRQLAEWLTRDRDAVQALIAALERGGQSEVRPELADERRAALRRAVRAQRSRDAG